MGAEKPTRVLLAGGGSAGHVNPLLAVAIKLKERGVEVVSLGTTVGLEKDLVPAAGIELLTIEKVPAPRRINADLFKFIPRLLQAYKTTKQHLINAQIDAVVGFGGYVSAPAYLAARKLGIPVVIHEQNMRPGLANKLGASWARLVGLTFPDTPLTAKHGLTQVVGLPLRPELETLAKCLKDPQNRVTLRKQAAAELQVDPDKLTLLVTGGSLGALKLNQVMAQCAGEFPLQVQVVHLTGKGKSQAVLDTLANNPPTCDWRVYEYLTDMFAVFALTDFAVCRSGAGTVAELTALGIPALYVPLPIGNGEQSLNASAQVSAEGALLIDDAAFTVEAVREQLLPLLKDSNRLSAMRSASEELGTINAATELADLVLQVLRNDDE